MSQASASRRVITPDSFSVATELLGKPLASPTRRAAAMLVDLILVAILVALGGGAFLGAVAGFVLWRASARFAGARGLSRWLRRALRALAAMLVFIVAFSLWKSTANRLGASDESSEEEDRPNSGNASFGNVGLDFSLTDGAALARLGLGLRREDDDQQARQLADSLVALLIRGGASAADFPELRNAAHQVAGSDENAVVRAAIDDAFSQPLQRFSQNRDSLARAYVDALQKGDSALVIPLRTALAGVLSEWQTSPLRRELAAKEREIERQRQQLSELRGRGSLSTLLSSTADDLGIGLGWSAVYFTSFLALMRGQTPGKRWLRVRVMRLDARPIGWWIAFERFGGYFASLTLGLLGFLQILWDRNRQGLHDKAVETVVVTD
ncbi:MAG: RDD family protein [Longimicrobiales bacterium]